MRYNHRTEWRIAQDAFQEFHDAVIEFLWLVLIDPVVIPLIVALTRAIEMIVEWGESKE